MDRDEVTVQAHVDVHRPLDSSADLWVHEEDMVPALYEPLRLQACNLAATASLVQQQYRNSHCFCHYSVELTADC